MNPYIQSLADEIILFEIKGGISEENELISKVRSELSEIKSEKDKLGLLSLILEANETEFQDHLKSCKNPQNCSENKKHQRVAYFLQQELEELGINRNTDHFSGEEKEEFNSKLDEILTTIIASGQVLDDNIQALRNEIEELKTLYVLGKKNWKQQLAGKLTDMTLSGVISDLTAKPIINNVLKPGVDFISDKFIG